MAAVALAGTTLFLAAEKDGLAYLDVAEWMTEKPCAVQVGSSDAAPEPLERAAEISSDKLRFVPVKTGQVCAVTPIDARRAFAVIKQGWVFTSLDTILVSLP